MEQTTLEQEQTPPHFLLIDLSYSIFFRYFSTKRWYGFAHPEDKFEDDYDWFENIVFLKSFEKNFSNSFMKIIKKYKMDHSNVILAKDCSRPDIWRNAIFPKYKENRQGLYGEAPGQVNVGKFFQHVYTKIIPKLCQEYGWQFLEHDQLEADDIIALTKKHLMVKNSNSKFLIITSDHDLMQLIDSNTVLMDLRNKMLNDKSTGNSQHDLLLKIICGDKSDCIPGCFKRCGVKTAMKLILDSNKLEEMFKKHLGSKDQFEKNKLLVDFNNIPIKLIHSMNLKLNSVFII